MIDYGIEIPNKIKCLPNTLYVEKIAYGQRKTKFGLYIPTETMDKYGEFVHPRWARVKYKADNIKDIEVGDWVLLYAQHWSTSMSMNINGVNTKLWFIDRKSFKHMMAISHTMPEELKEFGIEED